MLSPEYVLNILKSECGYNDGDSILAGVSGGADSVALLHLLHAAKVPVAAAHVNYRLRGEESDGDEKFVSELCAEMKVPLYVRRTDRAELLQSNNNLQAGARAFRLTFFDEIAEKESMQWLALAHHSDDNLETFLINFLRGSGIAGLAAMDFVDQYDQQTIRPLLNCSRHDIEEYLKANQFTWRNDSSNATDDYLRNRIRHHVIPAINSVDERHSLGWKHSLLQLKNTNELVSSIIQTLVKTDSSSNGLSIRIMKADVLEYANAHLIFNAILHNVGFKLNFSKESFQDFCSLQTGRKFYAGDMQLFVDRDYWTISENSSARRKGFTLSPGKEYNGWLCEQKEVDDPKKYIGYEAVLATGDNSFVVAVRNWKEGDTVQPYGFAGTKKVSDILTEMKVPSDEKYTYPVVTVNDEIAWIPGYRIAEKFKITPETKTALHIKWNRE